MKREMLVHKIDEDLAKTPQNFTDELKDRIAEECGFYKGKFQDLRESEQHFINEVIANMYGNPHFNNSVSVLNFIKADSTEKEDGYIARKEAINLFRAGLSEAIEKHAAALTQKPVSIHHERNLEIITECFESLFDDLEQMLSLAEQGKEITINNLEHKPKSNSHKNQNTSWATTILPPAENPLDPEQLTESAKARIKAVNARTRRNGHIL